MSPTPDSPWSLLSLRPRSLSSGLHHGSPLPGLFVSTHITHLIWPLLITRAPVAAESV